MSDESGGCPMPADCDESGHLTVWAEDGEYVMPCPHHRPIVLAQEDHSG